MVGYSKYLGVVRAALWVRVGHHVETRVSTHIKRNVSTILCDRTKLVSSRTSIILFLEKTPFFFSGTGEAPTKSFRRALHCGFAHSSPSTASGVKHGCLRRPALDIPARQSSRGVPTPGPSRAFMRCASCLLVGSSSFDRADLHSSAGSSTASASSDEVDSEGESLALMDTIDRRRSPTDRTHQLRLDPEVALDHS